MIDTTYIRDQAEKKDRSLKLIDVYLDIIYDELVKKEDVINTICKKPFMYRYESKFLNRPNDRIVRLSEDYNTLGLRANSFGCSICTYRSGKNIFKYSRIRHTFKRLISVKFLKFKTLSDIDCLRLELENIVGKISDEKISR